jgi:hypothetical protein
MTTNISEMAAGGPLNYFDAAGKQDMRAHFFAVTPNLDADVARPL